METFILISQAINLSVIFSVVTLFLLTWQWPATLLSILVYALLLYLFRERRPLRLSTISLV